MEVHSPVSTWMISLVHINSDDALVHKRGRCGINIQNLLQSFNYIAALRFRSLLRSIWFDPLQVRFHHHHHHHHHQILLMKTSLLPFPRGIIRRTSVAVGMGGEPGDGKVTTFWQCHWALRKAIETSTIIHLCLGSMLVLSWAFEVKVSLGGHFLTLSEADSCQCWESLIVLGMTVNHSEWQWMIMKQFRQFIQGMERVASLHSPHELWSRDSQEWLLIMRGHFTSAPVQKLLKRQVTTFQSLADQQLARN